MMTNADNNNQAGTRNEGHWCRSRNSGIFCGLMLLVIGAI